MMTTAPGITNIQYLTCNKVGLHEDEKLNLVCMETSCLQNLACCCACIEMEHKKHVTKPLKIVIEQARKYANSSKPKKMNIDILLDLVATQKKISFELFEKQRQSIVSSLANIELALQGYYNSIVEQIIIKNTDGNLLIEEAIERASNAKTLQELKFTLKKLVVSIPGHSSAEISQISEEELIISLQNSSLDIRKSINLSMQQANKRLSQYQENINSLINNIQIWTSSRYAFSETLKHTDIKMVNEQTIKSINNAGYKFAIMEPAISGKASRKISFKITESSCNWLAVGVCHKKIIQGKKFGFNFGSIGHGAYMVSSNGGSWSHLRADQNNTIKAFKFVKGDVVQVEVAVESKKIVFSLGKLTYELPYEVIAEDDLHPCVLFYYVNDEVQYLPHHKP